MPLIDGPDGPIEVRVTGSGSPTTVFAHGLAASIDETRPFGSGVRGTRVFLHFRGHGATLGPETPWTYASVAAELMAVVRRFGATRGLGVSLGAGALLRAAYAAPETFERLVLVLPGGIDRTRDDAAMGHLRAQAAYVEHADPDALAAALLAGQPEGARQRPDVALWAQRRARRLVGTQVARALRELPGEHPLDAGADLSRIAMPCLVIGQEGDPVHPIAIARELAERLPDARLAAYDDRGLVWGHRDELRTLIGGFLNPPG